MIILPTSIILMKKTLMPEGKTSKVVASFQIDPLMNRDNIWNTANQIDEHLQKKEYEPVIYLTDEKEFSADRWLIAEVPIDIIGKSSPIFTISMD